MTKIILTFLAIAVCAEATFDVGLLLNLLQGPKHKVHHPPPPPPPPRPPVYYRHVQHPVPVVPVQPVRYYYVQRTPQYVASYYRHPVSTPVDVPHFPPISAPSATAFADSVTVEAQPKPLSFTQVGSKQAAPAAQPAQSLSLPFAESGPSFSVETAKAESHSFALQPESQDQSQTSDTIEVQPEEDGFGQDEQ
ncbi:hypothetical protein quinque_015648 [Culex quinquefasciatus]